MTLIAALVGALAIVLLVPSTLVFVQTLFAALPFRLRERVVEPRPTLAVLMPAHNEAAGITKTLRAISGQLRPGDRLLVVADNCSDDTARVAAQGAEVLERTDSDHRGKGFALDFGIRHLAKRAPEVVVVVDADCTLAEDALDTLARTAALERRPVQALYLMRAPEGAAPSTRVAEFAWVVKNQVRPLGYHRLGLPCHLMGSGMAFHWSLIEQASLASGNIVEDLSLGLEFARGGLSPRFCPEALVTSWFPGDAGIAEQRTRWEHGHLSAIVQSGAKLLATGIASRDIQLLALALDLCVPPLALLALLLVVVLASSLLLYGVSETAWPAIVAACGCAAFATAVLLAWWQFGRRIISLRFLGCAVVYGVRKIPMYASFVTRRQIEWIRSRREGE
jgi:cellulose synthase/poly-beta-1,6-N-acetylglucosamine synthase-like glycosyltransferase